MNTKLVSTAADVIARAMTNGKQTPAGWAVALESAQLLQSPETAAEVDALRARLAGELASPLAWARLLDAKSLDNFMCALGMAADTDPADGALSQVEEMIRSFRSAVAPEAEEERSETLHDHIVARDAEIERLRARVAELEAERHSTNESLSEAAEQLRRDRDRIAELEAAQGVALRRTVSWRLEVLENDCWWDCGQSVGTAEAARDLLDRERAEKPGTGFRLVCRTTTDTLPAEGSSYPPALPWARLMDHEDLTDFLDELAASAITHATAEVALAEVEETCGRWRLIAEAQHAHNTAPGPDAEGDVTPQVERLRTLLAGQREQAGGDRS